MEHTPMTQPATGRGRASTRRSGRPSTSGRTDRRPFGDRQPRPDRSAFAGRPARTDRPARPSGRRRTSVVRAGDRDAAALDAALDASAQRSYPPAPSFADLGLPAPIVRALGERGIKEPFAIQARALPDALTGRDVLGRARTGSGKTLAFGLPVLTRLAAAPTARTPKAPRALVLVPTRELAQQVSDALTPLASALSLKVTSVVGGAPYGRQIAALDRGVDILVATPGRLIDLIDRGSCTLSAVTITVLDEADFMADLGFLPAVTRLLDLTPTGGQRLLFSATLDRGVAGLVAGYLTDPAVHAVAADPTAVTAMTHRVFTLRHEDKPAVAAEVASRPARTLFFVRTKHGADRLAKQLERSGVEAVAIHGNLGQGARQRALAAFTAGTTRVLVATDVAARGIHVDDVDLVVHYDPPNDHKDYLHRSGRTARAGAEGTVITLALSDQVRALNRLHRDARVEATTEAVHPGHPVVIEVGASGEPVVIREVTPARERTGGPRRGGGYRSRRPRGGRGRTGAPGAGADRRAG
jgi:superfamily II DNA/RNA helicase